MRIVITYFVKFDFLLTFSNMGRNEVSAFEFLIFSLIYDVAISREGMKILDHILF